MKQLLFQVGLFVLVGVAGVERFGWLSGLGIVATVYLLMPWQYGTR